MRLSAILVLTQLWQGVGLVLPVVRGWLAEPATTYSTLNLLWYRAFLLVAAPLSASAGTRWAAGGRGVTPANR